MSDTGIRNTYMRHKKYSDTPLQVRLHNYQEVKLNEMINDEDYCMKHHIYSKSDMLRKELNAVIKDYEQYKFNKSITTKSLDR